MVDDVKDEETQNVLLDSMGEMTKGGQDFNDATKLEVSNKVAAIVKDQVGTSGGNKRRKRRSLDAEASSSSGKTPSEVRFY